MDWIQVLTIVAATIASTYTFFLITREDLRDIKERMLALDEKFDNRIISIEERFDRRMEAFEADRRHTDEKWERLFERLLMQDKARAS
jgi:hypothetical protein